MFLVVATVWFSMRLGKGLVPLLLPTIVDRLAISPFQAGSQ
jgi:hypothetical protein